MDEETSGDERQGDTERGDREKGDRETLLSTITFSRLLRQNSLVQSNLSSTRLAILYTPGRSYQQVPSKATPHKTNIPSKAQYCEEERRSKLVTLAQSFLESFAHSEKPS